MKNIFPKIKINSATYILFLSFLLTGFIKNILLIFLIVIIHEIGHVFFLKYFHYKIEKVEIFPFGGLTTTNKYINSPINKDILIYFGGILFQILLYFLFVFINQKGFINQNTFSLFLRYNKSIFFFNLLPIRPLDGGEIIHLFLQKFFCYQKTLFISHYISVFFLIAFVLYNIKSNLNNYVIVAFLLYRTIDFFKKRVFFQNKFLLERFMYTLPYKKIEHNAKQDINNLKKETLHFFKDQNKYIHEKEVLKRKFDIHSFL